MAPLGTGEGSGVYSASEIPLSHGQKEIRGVKDKIDVITDRIVQRITLGMENRVNVVGRFIGRSAGVYNNELKFSELNEDAWVDEFYAPVQIETLDTNGKPLVQVVVKTRVTTKDELIDALILPDGSAHILGRDLGTDNLWSVKATSIPYYTQNGSKVAELYPGAHEKKADEKGFVEVHVVRLTRFDTINVPLPLKDKPGAKVSLINVKSLMVNRYQPTEKGVVDRIESEVHGIETELDKAIQVNQQLTESFDNVHPIIQRQTDAQGKIIPLA